MSSIRLWSRPSALVIISSLYALPSHALPMQHLYKREMGAGAKAGLGIGIAVAAILAVCIVVFLIIHFRRVRHVNAINKERAILAGEKNKDGSDKPDKFAPEPVKQEQSALPRRQKSVKDRLMGPLYRGSVIDLVPVPKVRIPGQNTNRQSTATLEGAQWESLDGQPMRQKPWSGGESSPRASFSSKRATRMMMMM